MSTISVCLAGMASCSLWTAFLEPIVYKRKIKFIDVILSIVAIIGMVIIFNVEFKYWLGLLLAIISALIASVFTIINAQFIRNGQDSFVITFYEMTGATIFISLLLAMYSIYIGDINLAMQNWDFLWMGILSLVCTVYAYSISVQIMKNVTPYVMNLTVNLEPVYGILIALIVFGESEKMSEGFYFGISLILLAVLAYPLIHRIRNQSKFKRTVS